MTVPGADDELLAIMERVGQQVQRAVRESLRRSARESLALTSHWNPDRQRIVHLFGKPYWWDRSPDGLLLLRPTAWINPPARSAR